MRIKRPNDIDKDSPAKDMFDLRRLYRDNVCNHISDKALNLFKKSELRRHIAIALWRRWCKHKRPRYVREQIAGLLCVSVSSVEKWGR